MLGADTKIAKDTKSGTLSLKYHHEPSSPENDCNKAHRGVVCADKESGVARWLVILFLACCGLAFTRPALAQAIDPAFERDIARLLEVTGAQKISEQMAQNFIKQFGEGMRLGNPDIPPRFVEIMTDVVRTTFQKEFGTLMQRMAGVYATLLTPDDVRQMLAFYDTPLGRRMIELTPRLAEAGSQAGSEWGRELVPGLVAELQRRMKAEGFIP